MVFKTANLHFLLKWLCWKKCNKLNIAKFSGKTQAFLNYLSLKLFRGTPPIARMERKAIFLYDGSKYSYPAGTKRREYKNRIQRTWGYIVFIKYRCLFQKSICTLNCLSSLYRNILEKRTKTGII